ncbi:hypothetical protein BWO91_17730 [Plantibacter flavus]|nr:hypothetical protein BWO91_17730 [Plantibacter flavus]
MTSRSLEGAQLHVCASYSCTSCEIAFRKLGGIPIGGVPASVLEYCFEHQPAEAPDWLKRQLGLDFEGPTTFELLSLSWELATVRRVFGCREHEAVFSIWVNGEWLAGRSGVPLARMEADLDHEYRLTHTIVMHRLRIDRYRLRWAA